MKKTTLIILAVLCMIVSLAAVSCGKETTEKETGTEAASADVTAADTAAETEQAEKNPLLGTWEVEVTKGTTLRYYFREKGQLAREKVENGTYEADGNEVKITFESDKHGEPEVYTLDDNKLISPDGKTEYEKTSSSDENEEFDSYVCRAANKDTTCIILSSGGAMLRVTMSSGQSSYELNGKTVKMNINGKEITVPFKLSEEGLSFEVDGQTLLFSKKASD
jgi:uncharacterized protein YxeA